MSEEHNEFGLSARYTQYTNKHIHTASTRALCSVVGSNFTNNENNVVSGLPWVYHVNIRCFRTIIIIIIGSRCGVWSVLPLIFLYSCARRPVPSAAHSPYVLSHCTLFLLFDFICICVLNLLWGQAPMKIDITISAHSIFVCVRARAHVVYAWVCVLPILSNEPKIDINIVINYYTHTFILYGCACGSAALCIQYIAR